MESKKQTEKEVLMKTKTEHNHNPIHDAYLAPVIKKYQK